MPAAADPCELLLQKFCMPGDFALAQLLMLRLMLRLRRLLLLLRLAFRSLDVQLLEKGVHRVEGFSLWEACTELTLGLRLNCDRRGNV